MKGFLCISFSLIWACLLSPSESYAQSFTDGNRTQEKIDSLSILIQQNASRDHYFERAWLLVDLEKWSEARADFEKAQTLPGNKKQTDIAAAIAYTYYRTGRYGLTQQWCDTSLKHFANNSFALLYRGWANYFERDLSAAESDFTRYSELRPQEPHGWYARQEVRRSMGEYVLALADIEKALEREPGNPLYIERKVLLLNLLQRKSEASSLLDQLTAENTSNNGQDLLKLARIHLRIGESGPALSYADRALRLYNDTLQRNNLYRSERQDILYEAYLLRGQINEKRGEYLNALRDYQRATAIDENGHEAWNHIGNIECTYRQNYYAAARAYRNCFRIEPEYPEGWVNWGYSLSLINRRLYAFEVYRRALSLDSVESRGLLLNNYGFTCLEMGYNGLARKYLERAVHEYPDLPMAYISLGEYFLEVKQYAEAIERLMQAVAMENLNNKEKQVANHKLGQAFFKIEAFDSALEYLNKALPFDPENSEVLFTLGRVHLAKGEYCIAAETLSKARHADEFAGNGQSKEISKWLQVARLSAGKSCR